MRALALNCTLKASPAPSSCELLLTQVDELRALGIEGEKRRVADHHIPPGVESDPGDDDEWPDLLRAVLEANILVLGTPIWMGQPSSVCKHVLERMDAFPAETDDAGRTVSHGRVAIVGWWATRTAVQHTSAELHQALSDVGFTVPASAVTYWVDGGPCLPPPRRGTPGPPHTIRRYGMSTIEETIEVGVPARAAYDQWTQFEEFPRFMEGVEEVRQLDDTHLHWRANVAGDTKEWDAEITEQVPERLIAWRATGGYRNAGVVHFEPVTGDRTRIHLQLDHEPEGAVEKIGDWLGLAGRRAKNDLERFREMIETRGAATGGWGGEVHGGATTAGTPAASAPLVAGHPGEGEQTTDPMPAHGSVDTGPGVPRDVTDGPTPETREALEDDEIRRRGGDDRI